MFINFLGIGLIFSLGYLIPLVFSLKKYPKGSTVFILLGYLIFCIWVYFQTPPQNISSILRINFLGAILGGIIARLMGSSKDQRVEIFDGKDLRTIVGSFKKQTGEKDNFLGLIVKYTLIAVVLFFVLWIYQSAASITSINNRYDTIQIQKVDQTEELKSTEETPIGISTMSAKNKMQKMMSVVPNSNMYSLGTISAQMVNGKYVYVASVEFRDFLKWLKLREVPGYFIMSATDVNAQPQFVKHPMRYTPSAYLWEDASRKIYSKATNYRYIGAVNLEVSDEGIPYYVQTLEKEYGLSGKSYFNKYKTGILNSVTGEVKVYDLKDTPKFIEAPLTSRVAQEINEFYGLYGNGWWNQWILGSKVGVKQPTANGIYEHGAVTPLVNKAGELFYFTDFTSQDSKQDSALGYSLINARTGQLQYYTDTKGMMDSDGAIKVAEKIYPEKKWEAKMPILYNIDGTPTWVISLLDDNGIFKKYVYLSAVDSDMLADGESVQGTLENYRLKLNTSGTTKGEQSKENLKEVTGKVQRVTILNSDKQATVNFMLENDPLIYTINTKDNLYSLFLKVGDEVSFKGQVVKDAKGITIEDLVIKGVTPEKH